MDDTRRALVNSVVRAARDMRDATRNALSELEEAGGSDAWEDLDAALDALDRHAEFQMLGYPDEALRERTTKGSG
jgi:hypothetical protein